MSLNETQSWRSIHGELTRRISERIWQPGDMIPGEVELAEEFGCARATVNRALRELADAGLLDRRRRVGTRVTRNPVRKATLSIPITRLEIEQRGSKWRHAVLSQDRLGAPALIASRLNLPAGHDVLHQTSVHFADSTAFLHEDRWINLEAVPDILDVDYTTISANEWLVQNAPFTEGDIALSSANATPQEAELLDTQTGAALFVIERTTWNRGMPITSVRLAYAPGYRIHMTI